MKQFHARRGIEHPIRKRHQKYLHLQRNYTISSLVISSFGRSLQNELMTNEPITNEPMILMNQ